MSSADQDDMPNWSELRENHPDKADAVKNAVGCALKHVTEALFDLVVRNEWRKVHGQSHMLNFPLGNLVAAVESFCLHLVQPVSDFQRDRLLLALARPISTGLEVIGFSDP